MPSASSKPHLRYRGRAFKADPEKGWWLEHQPGRWWWFTTWAELKKAANALDSASLARACGYNPEI